MTKTAPPNKTARLSKPEILKKEHIWDGFVKFYNVTVRIPTKDNGQLTITREVHDHGNGAGVLPVDMERQTGLLISQWRLPAYLNGYEGRLWEIVGGIIDPGEDAPTAAKRETLEETGYQVTKLDPVCEAYSSPGVVTERMHLFIGHYTPNTKQSDTENLQDDGEDIIVQEFPLQEIFAMSQDGRIMDAKSLLTIWDLKMQLK